MLRSLLALALLFGGSTLLSGAPNPDRRPVAADDAPVPDLTGTVWVGLDLDDVTTFRFAKGGKLVYTYNGVLYQNGTWKQDGRNIYFEMNQKFREFKGNFKGERNEIIDGDSWNVRDKRWHTTIYRYVDLDKLENK